MKEKNDEKNIAKFYYPICRIDNCGGVLKFKINKDKFSLNYKCEKNENHIGTNIFFKTFERFYLKEAIIDKCKKCNSLLENNIKYECKICQEKFCSSCFILHQYFQQNINNILINSKKCEIHYANNMHFCLNCKKYLCNYCVKEFNNVHRYHEKKKLYNLMPSKNILEKFRKRLKKYDDLIKSIETWFKELNQKIIRLKQNIMDEKQLFQKLTFNFNQSFINYSYFSNFIYLNKYTKNFNNEYLDNFMKSSTFKEKGNILLDYLSLEELESKKIPDIKVHTNINLECSNFMNIDNIAKITDNYFFKHSFDDKEIVVLNYNEKENTFYEIQKTKDIFIYKIYNVTVIDNLDKTYTIYVCLSNNKKIIIYNFDLSSQNLIKSNDKIIKLGIGHFKKVIQLSNEIIATSDSNYGIDVWKKDKGSNTGYSHLTEIVTKEYITDILSVNSDYFITSHYFGKNINFYNIETLSLEKSLNKINCLPTPNTLLKFDNLYIIVNCAKGLSVISIKTKEVVQFIQEYLFAYNEKELFLNSNNDIYIIYQEIIDDNSESDNSENIQKIINIVALKFLDSFEPFKVYVKIKVKGDLHLICVNDEKIMLLGKKIYSFDK